MVVQFRLLVFPALLYKRSYFTTPQTTSPNLAFSKRIYARFFEMHDEYVEVNGVPTRILTFGKWIEEPFKSDEKELILCITGDFFSTFFSKFFTDKVIFRKPWTSGILHQFCYDAFQLFRKGTKVPIFSSKVLIDFFLENSNLDYRPRRSWWATRQ